MREPGIVNGRLVGGYSLHDKEISGACPDRHHYRVIECGGLAGEGRDILECSRCGKQYSGPCDFDEEFS